MITATVSILSHLTEKLDFETEEENLNNKSDQFF